MRAGGAKTLRRWSRSGTVSCVHAEVWRGKGSGREYQGEVQKGMTTYTWGILVIADGVRLCNPLLLDEVGTKYDGLLPSCK